MIERTLAAEFGGTVTLEFLRGSGATTVQRTPSGSKRSRAEETD